MSTTRSKGPARGRTTSKGSDTVRGEEPVSKAKASRSSAADTGKGKDPGKASSKDRGKPSGKRTRTASAAADGGARASGPNPQAQSLDYEVGHGKPPRDTRFTKGQSGNPGGRRKGSINVQTILLAVAGAEIEIVEGGERRKIPLLEALTLRVVKAGLAGDMRAALGFFDRCAMHLPKQSDDASGISSDDANVIARYMERQSPGEATVDGDGRPRRDRGDDDDA